MRDSYTECCLLNMHKDQEFTSASKVICHVVSSVMCLWFLRAAPQTDKYAMRSVAFSSVTKQLRTPLTDHTACKQAVDAHAA